MPLGFALLKEYRYRVLLVILLWFGLLWAGWAWLTGARSEEFAFAAGPRDSESFRLATAIAEVYNTVGENSELVVLETSGSGVNAQLLAEGQVDFAVVQADTQLASNTLALASLYADAFQLIVNGESGIHAVPDLRGHRVAIPSKGSGQYQSFWFLAAHYGLDPDQLTAMPMATEAANFAMISGQVDAVFRVRAPGNDSIRELVRDHDMRIVPIFQARALALKSPAVMAGVIPLGSYRGSPPLPRQDHETAVLERILVSRDAVPDEIARTLTTLLFERRAELMASDRLAGFATPVTASGRITAPVHPGARQYYNREKPSFLEANTRLLSSLLYVVVILTSSLLALRASLLRRHKKRLVAYNNRLMQLTEEANRTEDIGHLQHIKQQLVDMLQEVVVDLEGSRVNQEDFEHFSFLWSAVEAVIKEKLSHARGSTP